MPDGALKEVTNPRTTNGVVKTVTYAELNDITSGFTSRIGSGGFGDVFRGVWNGRNVAVKRRRPEVRQGVDEIRRELELGGRMEQPRSRSGRGACGGGFSFVPVLAACMQSEAHLSLVYPLMSNGSLKDRLQCVAGSPPLRYALRLRIANQVACALFDLHMQIGYVHSDISSNNILLDEQLRAYLGDFGLSQPIPVDAALEKLLRPQSSQSRKQPLQNIATRMQSMRWHHRGGKEGYVDPEHSPSGAVKPSSDVYQFGIVLLELLTGQPANDPFKKPPELIERLRPTLNSSIPSDAVAEWPEAIHKDLCVLARQCVSRRGTARPLAKAVKEELQRLVFASDNELSAAAEIQCHAKEWAQGFLAAQRMHADNLHSAPTDTLSPRSPNRKTPPQASHNGLLNRMQMFTDFQAKCTLRGSGELRASSSLNSEDVDAARLLEQTSARAGLSVPYTPPPQMQLEQERRDAGGRQNPTCSAPSNAPLDGAPKRAPGTAEATPVDGTVEPAFASPVELVESTRHRSRSGSRGSSDVGELESQSRQASSDSLAADCPHCGEASADAMEFGGTLRDSSTRKTRKQTATDGLSSTQGARDPAQPATELA